ncbi:MAG: bifunctional phosphopantothenoylcysteine decarboxylase/phosphopantothenate--cysteine ligase CoaBC [Bacteroidetes bacterium]|nr:bifunctional phosphopantothenoylcysteine decarboxylase/phosphopantothenate--cysteine ligase CoaBC [Bacteroidota bacterium]
MLKGKRIVIGITGGIASYKIPFLIRLLIKEGVDIRVIMTPAATNFVTPLTLSALSRNPVIVDPFKEATGEWNSHVELGTWADLMIFAPVTANTLGKMAHGIADNVLVTSYLSAKCPVYLAPSMDLDMYNHPTTKKNIETLLSNGNLIIEPQVGELASGLSGPGRMAEPEMILQKIHDFFSTKNDLAGKNVLVTAGPTHEKIDAVRFIGNYSTGLMGFSLANEAAARGAKVTLIAGPSQHSFVNPAIIKVDVVTAEEMYKACMAVSPDMDIIIMSAAVADFTFPDPFAGKLKKTGNKISLDLIPTKDILSELSQRKRKKQILAGFALECDNELINAKEKLKNKNLDFIILNSLNDENAGFGYPTNKVTIIHKSGRIINGVLKDKKDVAKDIINAILSKS